MRQQWASGIVLAVPGSFLSKFGAQGGPRVPKCEDKSVDLQKKVKKTRCKGVFCNPSVCAKPLPLVCILSLNLLIILFVYVSLGQTKGVGGGFSTSRMHWWCPFFSKMSPLAAISRCYFLAFVWISLPVCGFFVSLVEWVMPLGMYYTICLSN